MAKYRFRAHHFRQDEFGNIVTHVCWLLLPDEIPSRTGQVTIQLVKTLEMMEVDALEVKVIGMSADCRFIASRIIHHENGTTSEQKGWLIPKAEDLQEHIYVQFEHGLQIEKVPASEIQITGVDPY